MWDFLCWKVDLIGFPKSTHGPSYLLGIKSYSCFFWWSELVVRSDLVLFWVRSGALSSCVHLSTTNVEYLGSITSLEVIKAQSIRNEFTCSCSFLARRLVNGYLWCWMVNYWHLKYHARLGCPHRYWSFNCGDTNNYSLLIFCQTLESECSNTLAFLLVHAVCDFQYFFNMCMEY